MSYRPNSVHSTNMNNNYANNPTHLAHILHNLPEQPVLLQVPRLYANQRATNSVRRPHWQQQPQQQIIQQQQQLYPQYPQYPQIQTQPPQLQSNQQIGYPNLAQDQPISHSPAPQQNYDYSEEENEDNNNNNNSYNEHTDNKKKKKRLRKRKHKQASSMFFPVIFIY